MNSLLLKIKWFYNNCRKSIPFIILLIIIGTLLSLTNLGKVMLSKYIIDNATKSNLSLIKLNIILLALLIIFQMFLSISQNIISTKCSEKLRNKLQENLYTHIINSKWIEHSKHHSVDLLTRITNDISTITNVIVNNIPSLISLTVMLISSFFAILTISKYMALFAIILFPLLILLSKLYGKKLKAFYIKIQQKETTYNSFLQESFNNILIIKSFCIEKIRIKGLQNIQNERYDLSLKKSYFSSITNGLLSLSSTIGYFSVLIWGVYAFSSKGSNAFGDLTAMLQLFTSIQAPIYGLSVSLPQFINALGAIDRINEIEKMTLEEPIEVNELKINNINFNNVSFNYDSGSTILKNINLNINSGETIGLVGPSGEGKTTLIRLLLSLIKPSEGTIKINNNLINPTHRKYISYVPQGNTLFSGTIRDNLSLGNESVTEDDIINCLKAACAYDFVFSLKNNINTVIGEKGLGISGGQAQRLAIARALIKLKDVLILDEATSSLDEDTEIKVLQSIKRLNPKPICIIITHRPSALSICDKVYSLSKTKLVEKSI